MGFLKNCGTATLADGSAEIGDVNGTADSVIHLTVKTYSYTDVGTPNLTPTFNPANNRLTISSSDSTDASEVSWSIAEPSHS